MRATRHTIESDAKLPDATADIAIGDVGSRLDNSRSDLSIGILSVGSEQLKHAITSVENQRTLRPYFLVRDVRPFSEAFRRIFVECRSRYVIQLDEDMELHPDATDRMLSEFTEQRRLEKRTVQMVFRLDDPLLGSILGVKIFDAERCGTVAVRESQFPDRDFNRDLERSGFVSSVSDSAPVGYHARRRTAYEGFLKHAISASKVARPASKAGTEWSPTNSDLDRMALLYEEAKRADDKSAFMALGGMFWGIFNEVLTDVRTYPRDEYGDLERIAEALTKSLSSRRQRDLARRCNIRINSASERGGGTGYYVKGDYYKGPHRSMLQIVSDHPEIRWDLLGIGYGEIALALDDAGSLRAIEITPSDRRRLDDPVLAAIERSLNYVELDDIGLDNITDGEPSALGLVIPHGTRRDPRELEKLIAANYSHVMMNIRRLEKSSEKLGELGSRLRGIHGWSMSYTDRDVTHLRRLAMAEAPPVQPNPAADGSPVT